jgi:hypothetical protein
MDVVAWPASLRWYEGLYVAAVAAVMAVAMHDPNSVRSGWFVVALIAALPAMVAGVVVLYVTGAAIWNLTGADQGGATWPVTVVYTVVVAVVASTNVLLFRFLRARPRRAAHH